MRSKDNLETVLHIAFERVPLEDGICHPADTIIEDALRSEKSELVLSRLRELVSDSKKPVFAASILQCLSRQKPGTNKWRSEVVRSSLASPFIEVRDAALQSAESWGDRGVLTILRNHTESVKWLKSYLEEVITFVESNE